MDGLIKNEPPAPEGADTPAEADHEAPAEADVEAPEGVPLAAADAAPSPSFRQLLRDAYFTFDRRTLGFSRIVLGYYLIMDLLHRSRSWAEMYSSEGVAPSSMHLSHASGMLSLFDGFSSPGELRVLWVVLFANFACLLVGYRTRVAQVLGLFLVTSMNVRVPAIENGGYVVQNLLLLWTCFLPLGDRFSLDALLASLKRRREASAAELNDRGDLLLLEQRSPHVTVLGPVLCIQLAAIYFFNVIHKTGPAWKNGTAVHYVLYVDRMATPIIARVRDHLPNLAIIFMTKTALGFEAGLPVALLSPLGRVWSRRAVIVMMNALHLAFGVTFVLGPFAWALCVFSTLFFSTEDWELATATMRRAGRARTVIFDPTSPGALLVCRVLARLDRFELLTFREGAPGPLGIAIEGQNAAPSARSAALVGVVSALPLGPILALPVRALRPLVDALLAAIERRSVSRWLGLRPRPSFTADGPSPLRRGARTASAVVRELLILLMFAAAVNQAMIDLWVINRRIKVSQPEPLATLARKLQFTQGWFMFSPNPVTDDGTLVVDAITVDGRHVDPFSIHIEPYTLRAPDFDLLHAKSLRTNQIWGDYFNRVHTPAFGGYRDALKEYVLRLPERTGHPADAIVSADVYWVQDMNPRWNEIESYQLEKNKIFSFENPAIPPPPSPSAIPPPPSPSSAIPPPPPSPSAIPASPLPAIPPPPSPSATPPPPSPPAIAPPSPSAIHPPPSAK